MGFRDCAQLKINHFTTYKSRQSRNQLKMSKIIVRPNYILYRPLTEMKKDDIDKLENEDALFQWENPRAFFWHDGPWLHHLKIVSVSFILAMLPVFFMGAVESLNLLLGWISIICIMPLAFIYYISRSQYYHVAYKISESGILVDILKIYPRFRYGRQDTTKVMHFLRVIAFILIIVALVVNPLYLIGAGGAVFVSFIKPAVDEGEKAGYRAFLWDGNNALNKNDDNKIRKINIIPRRRIISIACNSISEGVIVHCSKDNFNDVCVYMKKKFSDVDFVQEKMSR
jgi:hypothetical protein